MGFVADAEGGEPLGIDMLVERDGDWLKGYVERLGAKAVATDDLSTYKPVADRLGLEHKVCVCVVHARKNAARRLLKVKAGASGGRGRECRLTNCLRTGASG